MTNGPRAEVLIQFGIRIAEVKIERFLQVGNGFFFAQSI
jgi:hypothetical protein